MGCATARLTHGIHGDAVRYQCHYDTHDDDVGDGEFFFRQRLAILLHHHHFFDGVDYVLTSRHREATRESGLGWSVGLRFMRHFLSFAGIRRLLAPIDGRKYIGPYT